MALRHKLFLALLLAKCDNFGSIVTLCLLIVDLGFDCHANTTLSDRVEEHEELISSKCFIKQ